MRARRRMPPSRDEYDLFLVRGAFAFGSLRRVDAHLRQRLRHHQHEREERLHRSHHVDEGEHGRGSRDADAGEEDAHGGDSFGILAKVLHLRAAHELAKGGLGLFHRRPELGAELFALLGDVGSGRGLVRSGEGRRRDGGHYVARWV